MSTNWSNHRNPPCFSPLPSSLPLSLYCHHIITVIISIAVITIHHQISVLLPLLLLPLLEVFLLYFLCLFVSFIIMLCCVLVVLLFLGWMVRAPTFDGPFSSWICLFVCLFVVLFIVLFVVLFFDFCVGIAMGQAGVLGYFLLIFDIWCLCWQWQPCWCCCEWPLLLVLPLPFGLPFGLPFAVGAAIGTAVWDWCHCWCCYMVGTAIILGLPLPSFSFSFWCWRCDVMKMKDDIWNCC